MSRDVCRSSDEDGQGGDADCRVDTEKFQPSASLVRQKAKHDLSDKSDRLTPNGNVVELRNRAEGQQGEVMDGWVSDNRLVPSELVKDLRYRLKN